MHFFCSLPAARPIHMSNVWSKLPAPDQVHWMSKVTGWGRQVTLGAWTPESQQGLKEMNWNGGGWKKHELAFLKPSNVSGTLGINISSYMCADGQVKPILSKWKVCDVLFWASQVLVPLQLIYKNFKSPTGYFCGLRKSKWIQDHRNWSKRSAVWEESTLNLLVKEAFLHVYNHFLWDWTARPRISWCRAKLKFQPVSLQEKWSYSEVSGPVPRVAALDRNPAQVCQTLEQEITSTLSSEWLIMLHESSETLMFSVPDTPVQHVLLKCYSGFFLWFITLHIPTCTERHSNTRAVSC